MRKANGKPWTQADLAAAIGSVRNTVVGWETRGVIPRAPVIAQLAQTFGVSEEWLLGETDDSTRVAPAIVPRWVDVSEEPVLGVSEAAQRRYGPAVKDLPPRAYARLYEYRGRLRDAGASREQIDEAERVMVHGAYSKLNSGGVRDRTEDELIVSIDAGWAFVWELATEGGLKIPGPKPRFREATRDT